MNIKIMVLPAGSEDAQIPVYAVTLEHKDGVWDETFGTMCELNAFLTGLRAAFSYFAPVEVRMDMIPRFADYQDRIGVRSAPYQLWPSRL